MKQGIYSIVIILIFGFFSCKDKPRTFSDHYKILYLGDGYTKGQDVCDTCSFPKQLQKRIRTYFKDTVDISSRTIARVGWTTKNLWSKLAFSDVDEDYDFVTLLVGFNNHFKEVPLDVYKLELPKLISKSTAYANGNKDHVVVLSIADYSYTPFGLNRSIDSNEIKEYNDFIKQYCDKSGVNFLDVSEITDNGLENPKLIEIRGLYLSGLAYQKIVDKLFPLLLDKL